MPDRDIQLGLIGDNIAASRSPLLHRLVGQQNGLNVAYTRLVPPRLQQGFATVFDGCRNGGFRGINVTYPYKEKVVPMVTVDDPLVRGIGAVNTVIFTADGPKGHNTDYSGFVAAYRLVRRDAPAGAVCMIGTGGVGRAVAFGLVALGAPEIRLVDRDMAKAETLASDLRTAAPDTIITTHDSAALAGAEWAFDAVYTPADTQFLQDAAAQGLAVISGYELFIYQGVHAWALFSGNLPLNEPALRAKAFDRGERKFDLMQQLGTDLVLVCSTCHPASLGGIDPLYPRRQDIFRATGRCPADRNGPALLVAPLSQYAGRRRPARHRFHARRHRHGV